MEVRGYPAGRNDGEAGPGRPPFGERESDPGHGPSPWQAWKGRPGQAGPARNGDMTATGNLLPLDTFSFILFPGPKSVLSIVSAGGGATFRNIPLF